MSNPQPKIGNGKLASIASLLQQRKTGFAAAAHLPSNGLNGTKTLSSTPTPVSNHRPPSPTVPNNGKPSFPTITPSARPPSPTPTANHRPPSPTVTANGAASRPPDKPPLLRTQSLSTVPKPRHDESPDRKSDEDSGIAHSPGIRRLLLVKRDFVIDPEGDAIYYWSAVVASAVVYNFWAVILRIAFSEMRTQAVPRMFFSCMDVAVDLIYLLDLLLNFRMGFLEEGILVKDPIKLADNYMLRRKKIFIRDIISALPFSSIALLFTGMLSRVIICLPLARDGLYYPMLRLPKLTKCHTLFNFITAWDVKTNNPHLHRACKLLVYLWTTIHWIACFFYMLSEFEGLGSNEWVLDDPDYADPMTAFGRKYLRSMYWATMTLTTIGDSASPQTNVEIIFTGFTFLIGVFLFATVVGNVGDVISNMNAARMEFQGKMDGIKFYMTHHTIPEELQGRVKKWAEYSWNRTQAMDDHHMLDILPFRLRAEIAKHIHLETLQKVKIFEECEKGLLCELVVRLRSQIYSPADYICRKGEIGREMYIINHGKVEVLVQVGEQEPTVVATLTEGNYFGEISLLKLEEGCNRRNADVRSVGYSELLVLSKRDLNQALTEYPEARKALEKQARDRMSVSKAAERMQRTQAEQKLCVGPSHLGIGGAQEEDEEESKPGENKEGSKSEQAKMKEREMGELRHVLRELRAFDSQALKSKVGYLQEKCGVLERELEKKCEELHVAMTRMSHTDISGSGHKSNGLRREILTSTPVSGRSSANSSRRNSSSHRGHHGGNGGIPESPVSPFSPQAGPKQGRIVMSSLFQGFAWESGDKFHADGDGDEDDEDLPQYTVRILPVIVPGIAINDEIVQEPRKMHMAVNVRLEPEKKVRPHRSEGRLERSSSVISLDGVDDDTIDGFSMSTKDSSTLDGDDSSLEDSSEDEDGSGGSDTDLD